MEKNTFWTPIIFRKDKQDKDVFAIFPDDVADLEGHVTFYQHVGQHGHGDLGYMMQKSVPASPKEYAELKKELEGIGYKVKPVLKDTKIFQEARREQLGKLNG